jgi:hypothetical protein
MKSAMPKPLAALTGGMITFCVLSYSAPGSTAVWFKAVSQKRSRRQSLAYGQGAFEMLSPGGAKEDEVKRTRPR